MLTYIRKEDHFVPHLLEIKTRSLCRVQLRVNLDGKKPWEDFRAAVRKLLLRFNSHTTCRNGGVILLHVVLWLCKFLGGCVTHRWHYSPHRHHLWNKHFQHNTFYSKRLHQFLQRAAVHTLHADDWRRNCDVMSWTCTAQTKSMHLILGNQNRVHFMMLSRLHHHVVCSS